MTATESYPQPPSCNTGVATTEKLNSRPVFTVLLDYLAGHIERDATMSVPALAAEMGATYRMGRSMHGYAFGVEIVSGEDVWVRCWYNHGGHAFFQASGANAQPCEDAIKRLGLPWRCTRKDAALDLYDAEWFPVLVDVAKKYAMAGDPPLKVEFAGDWQYAKKGRTFYLGARTSKWFHRLYEKGRKERDDPNWIRCEVQYNPQTPFEQEGACNLTPAQIWCMHAYAIFGAAIGIPIAEVWEVESGSQTRVRRDEQRARRALGAQYGKIIERWLQDTGGDPVAFVSQLLAEIEHQRTVRTWRDASAITVPELSP